MCTQLFKLSPSLPVLGGYWKRQAIYCCIQRLLVIICYSYRDTYVFLTWILRKLYSNTHFSGPDTIKLPTQVYITLSKTKMWKISIYTAAWGHRNSLLWSHFITSYTSHWIIRASGCLPALWPHAALAILPAHQFPKVFTACHSQPEPKVVHFNSVLLDLWLL